MIETTTDIDLVEELRELRQTVATLQATLARRHRVDLRAERPQPFLGQPVTLVARVTEAAGAPRAGVPVIFSTTWGRLQTADGYALRRGTSVTARTHPDGTARVILLPPAAEELTSAQQDSLIAMLARLDPQAAGPEEVRESLEELVEQYRWTANLSFRQAVDILFREFRDEVVDTVNGRDLLGGWTYFEATVFAHVPGVEEGSAVDATGAVSLRFKDWLAPWLETHLRLSPAENALVQDLERVKKKAGNEAAPLLDGIYDQVRRFVDDQEGLVGRFVGQKVAETSIRRFATTAIDDLPRDVRNRLFRSLDVASRAVRTAGVHVLSEVGKARRDANAEADAKIDRLDVGRIDTLTGQVREVEEAVGRKAEASDVTDFRTKVDEAFDETRASLKSKLSADSFETFRTKVDGSFGRIDTLTGQVREVEEAVGRKAEASDVTNFRTKVDEGFDETRASLKNKLSADSFETYKTETRKTLDEKLERKTFETAGRLTAIAFQRYQKETGNTLAEKADHDSVNTLKTALISNLESLQRSVRGFTVLDRSGFEPFRRIPR